VRTKTQGVIEKKRRTFMPPRQLNLLSFGIFVIIVAVLLIAFFPDLGKILALTLTLYGLWVIALAGIRAKSPQKYERGAFSTFIWGILLLAIGGAWYLYIFTEGNMLYSVVLFLVIVGILAVVVALYPTRKKQI
jgi:apolipoprotein N-acyltransferase